MAWLYSWPLQAQLGLGFQGVSHSVHKERHLGLKGTGRGGSQVCCTNPTARLLPLRDAPGDFDFIYKQDENPSSINLEEQKRL